MINGKCSMGKLLGLAVLALASLAAAGGGRLSAEETAAARALRARVTLDVIAKWSPEVRFHRLERFFPTSIEDLLKGARLYQDPDKDIKMEVPRDKAIPINGPDALRDLPGNFRIQFDPANPKVRGGDRGPDGSVTAPMYVSVQIPPDASYVKLLYRFLFGFNGPQSMRCHDGIQNFNYALPCLAEHEGDWEGVNIVLAPDLNAIVSVTTEAHGNQTDNLVEDLDWTENTHCQVRSAANSHGTYNGKGLPSEAWFTLEKLGVLSVVDIISSAGPLWQPWKQSNNPFRLIGRVDGAEVGREVWASYRGRMGSYKENPILAPCDLNGGGMSAAQYLAAGAQTALISTIRFTTIALTDTKVGAPCGGPGSRPEMNLVLPAPGGLRGGRPCVIYSRVGPHNLVLSLDPGDVNAPLVLSTYRQGDTNQRWFLVDLGDGRTQFLNEKTGKAMRLLPGGQGKRVTTYSPLAKTGFTTWTIAGDRRNNCAIRPAVTDSQNLDAFGNSWRDGSPVGTWDWGGGQGNETWRIVEQ